MTTQSKLSKPKFKVIQGDNESLMRLIHALDKAAGFKHGKEAIQAFHEASATYCAEHEAARAKRSRLKLVPKKKADEEVE